MFSCNFFYSNARSHCTEAGPGAGTGPGTGAGSTVHIAAGTGLGMGTGNIMLACLHVLEITLFQPCASVFIILERRNIVNT